MSQPLAYTAAEHDILRRLYATAPMEQLLKELPGRTRKSIQSAAARCELTRRKKFDPWSKEEDAMLRASYREKGAPYLSTRMKRSIQAIKQRATRLALTNGGPATYRRPAATPAPTTEHDPRPKASNTLKPMQASKARQAEPVKRSPLTPNLNASAEAKRRREAENDRGDILGRIRKLPPNSKGREIFTIAGRENGIAAKVAFLEWEAQQAA